jgi:hypothetical protein
MHFMTQYLLVIVYKQIELKEIWVFIDYLFLLLVWLKVNMDRKIAFHGKQGKTWNIYLSSVLPVSN